MTTIVFHRTEKEAHLCSDRRVSSSAGNFIFTDEYCKISTIESIFGKKFSFALSGDCNKTIVISECFKNALSMEDKNIEQDFLTKILVKDFRVAYEERYGDKDWCYDFVASVEGIFVDRSSRRAFVLSSGYFEEAYEDFVSVGSGLSLALAAWHMAKELRLDHRCDTALRAMAVAAKLDPSTSANIDHLVLW